MYRFLNLYRISEYGISTHPIYPLTNSHYNHQKLGFLGISMELWVINKEFMAQQV
jgi:hypothetical protein